MSSCLTPARSCRSSTGAKRTTTHAGGSSTGGVVSTEAVLTEATHLLTSVDSGVTACVDFFLEGGAILVPSTPASLKRVRALLQKYADLPMDFADATLVVLGEDLGSPLVFTTDRTDFTVYRLNGRKPFRIVPGADAQA